MRVAEQISVQDGMGTNRGWCEWRWIHLEHAGEGNIACTRQKREDTLESAHQPGQEACRVLTAKPLSARTTSSLQMTLIQADYICGSQTALPSPG